MTIDKKTFKLIKNNHIEKTEMLLNKLLQDKDMSQADFAKKIDKDPSTINRWIKNSRSISWDNAIDIADILNIHPIEVYQPNQKVKLQFKCTWDCIIEKIEKENQTTIKIPYEYNHEFIRAVQMDCPGTSTDGEIWLFDIPKNKKFVKSAIGRLCYMKSSETYKNKNKKNGYQECVALLKPNGNGTFDIIHNHTAKHINEHSTNLLPSDFEIASPVKAKFDPELLNFINK